MWPQITIAGGQPETISDTALAPRAFSSLHELGNNEEMIEGKMDPQSHMVLVGANNLR